MTTVCRLLVAIALAPALASGCAPEDEGDETDAGYMGPTILGTNPLHEAEGIDRHPVIELELSDHLDGRSVSRPRFTLRSGGINMWLMTYYDPVDRKVRIWTSGALRKNLTYEVEVNEGLSGLNGGEVEPGRALYFTTGEESSDPEPFERYSFETHVKPIVQASCASCHQGASPMAGLDLSSYEGFKNTAVMVPAEGWSGWERIVPAKPGESYLMYKILADDRIAGSPMPRNLDGTSATTLSQEELKIFSDWVAGGASRYDTAVQEQE